jgi:hypothetical protein
VAQSYNEVAVLRLTAIKTASTLAGITTGLSFNFVPSSFYTFDIYASCNASAATTGIGMCMAATGTNAGTGNTYGLIIASSGNATYQVPTIGFSTANATFGGYTSGFPTAATIYPISGSGYLYTGSPGTGTITFWIGSEVAGTSVSLNPGSIIIVRKIS